MRPMNGKAKRVEYLVAKFINERRADRGKDRLDTDRALTAAAREHSRDMARRGYVDHVNRDGESPHDRCKRYGNVGECIAKTSDFSNRPADIAADIVRDLMQSRPHRNAIMDAENEKMGVGVWKDGSSVLASVELYGKEYGRYKHHHGTARTSETKSTGLQPSGKLERKLGQLVRKVVP